jgi:sugar lactone lactonase YvrE
VKPQHLLLALALVVASTAPALACPPVFNGPEGEKMLKEGYDLDRQGEYAKAAEIFKKVIQMEPGNRKAHYYLANTYWRDNQFNPSRKEWEIVLRMKDQDRWGREARDWIKDNKTAVSGGQVTTVAYLENGKQVARFRNATSLAISSTGTMYVADAGAHMIRRITPEGIITTAAGSGAPGYQDGPAGRAMIDSPSAMAMDPVGNLYFVDQNRVRFLTAAGQVGTLAGSEWAGSQDGVFTNARLDKPTALAVDRRGNVYVAEGKNPAIRAITPQGEVKLMVGGSKAGLADGRGGDAQFKEITAMKFAPNGDLLVLDAGNNRIRRVTKNGEVFTIKGCNKTGLVDGPVSMAHFGKLSGLALDADGKAYVADGGNRAVRMISAKGEVSTLAGGGGRGMEDGVGISATFEWPSDIAVLDKHVYVLDKKSQTIRRVTTGR